MPSATRTAEARVVFSSGKYRRFARNVICPASACSIPATPRISSSGGPSNRHPSLCATSASFMERAPQSFVGLPASLAQAKEGSTEGLQSLFVEEAALRRRPHHGRPPARRGSHPPNQHINKSRPPGEKAGHGTHTG